jgi:hypothetical protein
MGRSISGGRERPMNRPLGRDGPPGDARKAATSRESAQGWICLDELPSARQGERLRREPGTGNRKRRTVSELAIMARDGQVLPPVPAPGTNALCRALVLSIASPQLRELRNSGTPPRNSHHPQAPDGGWLAAARCESGEEPCRISLEHALGGRVPHMPDRMRSPCC